MTGLVARIGHIHTELACDLGATLHDWPSNSRRLETIDLDPIRTIDQQQTSPCQKSNQHTRDPIWRIL